MKDKFSYEALMEKTLGQASHAGEKPKSGIDRLEEALALLSDASGAVSGLRDALCGSGPEADADVAGEPTVDGFFDRIEAVAALVEGRARQILGGVSAIRQRL